MVNFAWRPALLEIARWQLEVFLWQLSVSAAFTCYLQAIPNLQFGQFLPCNYLLLASCIVISWCHLGREVNTLGCAWEALHTLHEPAELCRVLGQRW